jgi:periplasmic protein TonB
MLSAVSPVSFRAAQLPWSVASADEQRFHCITQRMLLAALVLCLALPWLPVVKEIQVTPAPALTRVAKLLLAPEPLVVPPMPAPAQRALPVERKALPAEPARAAPVKSRSVPEARAPQPGLAPGEVADNVRRKVAGVGLLAMTQQLNELRGAPLAVQLKQDIQAGPGVGTGTGPGVGAGTEPGVPTRALITANAAQGSGGINTASYSRHTGGGGLAGRATTLVEGVPGGGGGNGLGAGGAPGGKGQGAGTSSGNAAGGTLQRGGSSKASRSIEEIKLVFERNKGAIYAIYNRALREDPSLQGKVVVELKIAPSGSVLNCRIVSSELRTPELEQKLLARIKQFDFGAKDVDQLVLTWPVDFLPS